MPETIQGPFPNHLLLSALIAFVPLLWLLIGLGILKIKAYTASLISLTLAIMLSITAWGMPAYFVFQSVAEGVITGLWPIVWVIIAAIYTYNVTVETGSMNVIKTTLAQISPDRRIQALILAFSFGGFLEAAAGFGTAVAIPASILAGIGFEPIFAAVICLIANTVPVAFGGIGIPIITLSQVTGISESLVTKYAAYQLVPFIIILPIVLVVIMTKSFEYLKDVLGICLVSGISFALLQTLVAVNLGPEVAAIAGSLASLLSIVVYVKVRPVKQFWFFPHEKGYSEIASTPETENKEDNEINRRKQFIAWTPYIVLFILIMAVNLIPSLGFLGKISTKVQIYTGPGGKPFSLQWVTTPGTIMFISAVVGGLIQGDGAKELIVTFLKTIKQLVPTIIVVTSIVAMAKVMGYSGMISVIAVALAHLTGKAYPFISPLIGALGTFITGSDTSSNILFGPLQRQTALEINVNPAWIAAANAVGATAGKMISPQSIAVAASATGLVGKEGLILNSTLMYCALYAILIGIVVFAFGYII
ncbi:L-lactate permease [Tepidanaerobacter sp. GT38]|uniref:L-lactate permease n=1 Tax=Tepidanaerobacter sp. GT38 TaxID=2722793 RepID=UPI001F48E538|nr:L-lactate permease [Tepidanaerobacter sp. GT38]MCG1013142.1 L-lactate permease [Tepidanaerobacter sp. GT38]